ncbi:AMP-dependent synthetase [Mycobacterium intermedium]|uniref:AMP-dependent synthetase n=1 Tax=Mycobacterium intermedium TaxID=28445 RepID=A0A1E3SJE2_MYCIE|nr:AMP-binding protein [Mycobacterium intermedium]MCV6963799.1 AMP-binding protein [Mycobacterium intermedium]ODR02221.1 AMP-dependent synthetase [Mycobacterium intermedium]OPE52620.1 AMP-dependent synthetase [Mycobacterium intermedium]ORB10151.1 AMP-dependent synthetase [Mycobacterium intermedium]
MTEPAALVFEERRFSLPELDALAGGLAATLRKRGVQARQRVAVMSSNRPEFVAALCAIWKLGASAVLISPAWKRDEVDHALGLTAPAHAVGDHPVLADAMPMLHLDEPIAPVTGATTPRGEPAAGDDAVLVFSSGTTGLPKAVRHTHASLEAAVRHWRDALQLTERDRIQVATPPSHILGLLNIVTALRTGAWVRLHSRFDVDRMLRHIESDRITIEMAVAPIALAVAAHPALESFDLSSLRYIMWGATPVTASIAETVTRRAGVGWVPAYGSTELPVIACNPLDGPRLDAVGRAVPGVDVRVVSLDTGQPVGPGDVGEIQARSNSLMAGYLPDAATGEAMQDGWYRTGDVGWVDADGWLRITDRLKEMIKVRGFQVAPAEIETVLLGHPAVKDCAVFGVPDGANGEAVVAAVATHKPVEPAELAARVDAKLASYKRLSRVVFVPDVPRLPSGKVLRRVLKESYGCTSDG